MDLLTPRTINCSTIFIKFNEMKNKIFLDALSKSDARWDGKQKFFYMALRYQVLVFVENPLFSMS